MSKVTATGPVCDGRAITHVSHMTEEIVRDVGQDAVHQVGAALDTVLKNPTGYYESQITIDLAQTTAVVHDAGVVYGPWLAGVSSRNDRSRFKGYAHWQRARQRTQRNVPAVARPVVAKHVRKMNGS